MRAVVLAGGGPDAVSAGNPSVPNKAFVPIGGVPLVQRTISALRDARLISEVTVVAPLGARDHPALAPAHTFRESGPRISDSLRAGLAGFADDELVAIANSDLPVLTAEAVDDFVARAGERDPDLAYTCVERSVHRAKYPNVPHTWAHLSDGIYCGGGLVALRPRSLLRLLDFLERLGEARKSPLRLAAIFGWGTLAAFAFRRLSINGAECRASELLGAPVIAVASAFPEIAVNVNRVSDIAVCERLVCATPQQ